MDSDLPGGWLPILHVWAAIRERGIRGQIAHEVLVCTQTTIPCSHKNVEDGCSLSEEHLVE